MKSPYGRILVYDIETGGLKEDYNSITEIAIVAVDFTTLEIEEEFTVAIKPYMDLSFMCDDPVKQSKLLYKNLSIKDDVGKKFLEFRGERLSVMDVVEAIEEPVRSFIEYINTNYPKKFLKLPDILKLLSNSEHKDVMKLYFNNAYNPEALEVTKITTEFLVKSGVEFE